MEYPHRFPIGVCSQPPLEQIPQEYLLAEHPVKYKSKNYVIYKTCHLSAFSVTRTRTEPATLTTTWKSRFTGPPIILPTIPPFDF